MQTQLSKHTDSANLDAEKQTPIEEISIAAPDVYVFLDSLVDLQKHIAEAVTSWNIRLLDVDQQQKRLEKNRTPQKLLRETPLSNPESVASSSSMTDTCSPR